MEEKAEGFVGVQVEVLMCSLATESTGSELLVFLIGSIIKVPKGDHLLFLGPLGRVFTASDA